MFGTRSVPLYEVVKVVLQNTKTPVSRDKLIDDVVETANSMDELSEKVDEMDVEHEVSKALLDLKREGEVRLMHDWKSVDVCRHGSLC